MNFVLVIEILKNSRIITYMRYFFLTVVILIIGFYLHENWSEVKNIPYPNFHWLILLCLIVPLPFLVNGWLHYHVLKHFGLILPFKEWFGLSVMNTFMNYALPFQGGIGFRSIYLKTKYDFKFSLFISLLTIVNVIIGLTNTITGLLCALMLKNNIPYRHFSIIVVIFCFVLFCICGLF